MQCTPTEVLVEVPNKVTSISREKRLPAKLVLFSSVGTELQHSMRQERIAAQTRLASEFGTPIEEELLTAQCLRSADIIIVKRNRQRGTFFSASRLEFSMQAKEGQLVDPMRNSG